MKNPLNACISPLWLSFTEQGQIMHQVDWINYPGNLLNYNNRKNANDWLQ